MKNYEKSEWSVAMRTFWKFIVAGILAGWGVPAYAGSAWTENASGTYAGTGAPWTAYAQDGKWVTSGTENAFTSGAAITASDGPLTVSGAGTVLTVTGNRLKVKEDGVLTIENASVNGNYADTAAGIRIGTEGFAGTAVLRNGSLAITSASNKNIFIGSDNESSVGFVRSYGASAITADALFVGVRGNSSHTSELSVEDGTLTVTGMFAVGGFMWGGNTGCGLATVKAGAKLVVTGNAFTGYAGTGTLDVFGTVAFQSGLTVGNYLTEGEPSALTLLHGNGTLIVRPDGVLTVSGTTTLGHASNGRTQSVRIDGMATLSGATEINRADVAINGTLNAAALKLKSNSKTTVSGKLTTTGELSLEGSSTLTIARDGVVSTGSKAVNLNSNTAVLNVSGSLLCGNQINFGCGVLNVFDGGTVQFEGNPNYSRVGNSGNGAGFLYVYSGGTVIDHAEETMVGRSNSTEGHVILDGGTYLAENANSGRGFLTIGGHRNDASTNVTASLDVWNGGTLKVNTLYVGSVGAGSTITATLGNLNPAKISTVSAKVGGMTVGWRYASTADVNYADVDVSSLAVMNRSTLNVNGGADIDVAGAFTIASGSTVNFNANALGMGNLTAGSLSNSGTINLGVSGAAPMNAKTYTIYQGNVTGFNVADAGIWSVTNGTSAVTVTLAAANQLGEYEMGVGTLNFGAAASAGWVQLNELSTDRYELTFTTSDLTAGQSASFEEWLNGFFSGSGIEATALDASSYQLTGLKNLADTAFFAWDFSGFKDATVTMSALSGQSVPEPAAWLLLAFGLFLLNGWRRGVRKG